MFLRKDITIKKGKRYISYRVVKVYWDKVKKKIRHKTMISLGKLKEKEVKIIKNLLSLKDKKDAFIISLHDIKIRKSLQYLAPVILHKIFNLFSFCEFIDKEVNKRCEVNVSSIFEILVLFRCIKPTSDLKVSSFCKKTILPYLLNIPVLKINPTRIYRALDEIIKCEDKLQKHIYNKIKKLHLDDFNMVYYDITSTYFEGKGECNLILYGLSRDKRQDKKQILLALAVTKKGYPFYWDVLPGNIVDKTTVKNIVNNLREKFNIKSCCIVLDRGMITDENLQLIEDTNQFFICTLTKDEIYKLESLPYELLKSINIDNVDIIKQGFKFYNKRCYYKELPPKNNRRYILCFNPEKFLQEREDRCDKIKDIEEYFKKKNKDLSKSLNRRNKEKIEREIYYYLKKRKAIKYFKNIVIDEEEKEVLKKYKTGYKIKLVKVYSIKYKINEEQIEKEKLLDGVYVICSNLYKDSKGNDIKDEDVISSYRNRIKIERAFLDIKSLLELRPIYHKDEFRIKAHVLICCIAYLLNVTLEYKVRDIGLLDLTHNKIYEILEGGNIDEIEITNIKKKILKIVSPDIEQNKIIKALGYEDVLSEDKLLGLIKKL